MNISPKRMAQIDREFINQRFETKLGTALALFEDETPHRTDTIQQFVDFLATDPAPVALTVDDLSDEDRLGWVLAKSSPSKMEREAAEDAFLNSKKEAYYAAIRQRWTRQAQAVAAEARRQIERDYILVPRKRDEDEDAKLFYEVWGRFRVPSTGLDDRKAGIAAVLNRYDSAGAGTRATGENR